MSGWVIPNLPLILERKFKMCFKSPPPPPAKKAAPPPPPPPTPSASAPSASGLPDSTAYAQAYSNKRKGQSIRNQLRIELGTGGGTPVGTGINTNQ